MSTFLYFLSFIEKMALKVVLGVNWNDRVFLSGGEN